MTDAKDRRSSRGARPSTWSAAVRNVAALFASVSVGAASLGPLALTAQDGRSLVDEGNRLYEEGRFEEAHRKYLEALGAAPSVPAIHFNSGNALYRMGDFEAALEAYEEALRAAEADGLAPTVYNSGNAFFRRQQLQESLEAYKEALRIDPGDLDAKHNLEVVLKLIEEQEEQEQSGDGDDDQEPQDRQEQDENENENGDPEDDRQEASQGADESDGDDEGEDGSEGYEEENPDEGGNPADSPPGGGDPENDERDGQGRPQPREGRMTEEEARRLLGAIDEDPEGVERRPPSSRGRRPRKPW